MGSRCLARLEGSFAPGTIRAVFADGTFRIELDQRSSIVLPAWIGVTHAEVLFDDYAQWPACCDLHDLRPFDLAAFTRFVIDRGSPATAAQIAAFWSKHATATTLDERAAYDLVVRAGFTATATERVPNGRVYWNQTRMGGRDASELVREVTVADALEAIGLEDRGRDLPSHAALPLALRRYFAELGDDRGIGELHPNNPALVRPRPDPIAKPRNVEGELGVRVLEHHDFAWWAVWNRGDVDARVYVTCNDTWRFAAPTVGMFFWDLAQTALAWWTDTKLRGGKPTRRTDVGLALVRAPR